ARADEGHRRRQPVREGGDEACLPVRDVPVARADEAGVGTAPRAGVEAGAVQGRGRGNLHLASEWAGPQSAGGGAREAALARRGHDAQLEHSAEASGDARRVSDRRVELDREGGTAWRAKWTSRRCRRSGWSRRRWRARLRACAPTRPAISRTSTATFLR